MNIKLLPVKDNEYVRARSGIKVPVFPGETQVQRDNDSVKALVQSGELVVPLKHVDMVENFLRSKGVYDKNRGMFL